MQIRNNRGELIGEIDNIVGSDGSRIISSTIYSNDRVVSQTVTRRDDQGAVTTETTYGGKLIP